MSNQNIVLVEHWYDSLYRQIDLAQVHGITQKQEEKPNHYHAGFGRAEEWIVTFKDKSTLNINGCPPALERFKL